MTKEGDNSSGTASVILGILSVASVLLTLFALLAPLVGIILGIISLFFAISQKKHEKNKWSKYGMILAIIGIAINLLLIIGFASSIIPAVTEFKAQCDAYGGCDKYLAAMQIQQVAGAAGASDLSDIYSQYGIDPSALGNSGISE